MNWTMFSDVKDLEDRSSKECVCGGHNLRNAKANKLHNATKKRLEIRRNRKQRHDGPVG